MENSRKPSIFSEETTDKELRHLFDHAVSMFMDTNSPNRTALYIYIQELEEKLNLSSSSPGKLESSLTFFNNHFLVTAAKSVPVLGTMLFNPDEIKTDDIDGNKRDFLKLAEDMIHSNHHDTLDT